MVDKDGSDYLEIDGEFCKGKLDISPILVLSLLAKRNVKIGNLKMDKKASDLLNLCKLISPKTEFSKHVANNGSLSNVIIKSGHLVGGQFNFTFKSNTSMSYFARFLVQLAFFCKEPLNVKLHGLTACNNYPSVDFMRFSTIPLIKFYLSLDESDVNLSIEKRSISNQRPGTIHLKLPIIAQVRPMQLLDIGRFDRIRGLAWSMNIPPEISAKTIQAAKDQLCKCTTNVYVATDYSRDAKSNARSDGAKSKLAQGCAFGLTLYAETKSRRNIASEAVFIDRSLNDSSFDPIELGGEVAKKLILDIYRKAYTDNFNQSTMILLMALSESHVSSIRLSALSKDAKAMLRYLKLFFNHEFKLEIENLCMDEQIENSDQSSTNAYILKCMGTGYRNFNRIQY